MQILRYALLLSIATVAAAQTPAPSAEPWQMQESGTTAGLRGIHSVDGTVAWASGTGGTVLKTTDGGQHWQRCATPDADKDGATLDFRGIQAWDANTAIVMASGPGDKSRLYKTTDSCKSWKLIFTNPDETGFFDAILLTSERKIYVLGDPVSQIFALFQSEDLGDSWYAAGELGRDAEPGEASFAASNSELIAFGPYLLFGTGGTGSRAFVSGVTCHPPPGNPKGPAITDCVVGFHPASVPVAAGSPASGVFSTAARAVTAKSGAFTATLVAVGGVYDHPEGSAGTAAVSTDSGKTWLPSATPPHGYRSTVQWSESLNLWITAGTNGSDISRDDGRTWQPLDNGNWNALSLPFIVGPNGRIARLNSAALPKP